MRRVLTPVDQILSNACAPCTQYRSGAARHRLDVQVSDPPGWVYADQTRIAQALANLLNNAANCTPRGGTTTLSCIVADGHVVVRCRDSGIGISPATLPNIFDRFRSGSGSSSGGLGKGLSLAHRLLQVHDGTREVRSDGPGAGCEFVVLLPAVAAIAPADEDAVSTPPAAARRRVLIIDDNRDSAEMLETLLTVIGHDPSIAFTAASGIEAALSQRPDVVLLDIGLPDMSGYEVARRLRAEPALHDLTLIALTGWGQPEDRARAKEAGFDHHLTKPADPDALAALLAAEV